MANSQPAAVMTFCFAHALLMRFLALLNVLFLLCLCVVHAVHVLPCCSCITMLFMYYHAIHVLPCCSCITMLFMYYSYHNQASLCRFYDFFTCFHAQFITYMFYSYFFCISTHPLNYSYATGL